MMPVKYLTNIFYFHRITWYLPFWKNGLFLVYLLFLLFNRHIIEHFLYSETKEHCADMVLIDIWQLASAWDMCEAWCGLWKTHNETMRWDSLTLEEKGSKRGREQVGWEVVSQILAHAGGPSFSMWVCFLVHRVPFHFTSEYGITLHVTLEQNT